MGLHIYRYGQSSSLEGLSIGVTRFPPRGVRSEDYARLGYCDVWMPLLGPSPKLMASYKTGRISFKVFSARYRAEMREPAPRQAIRLVAAMSCRIEVNLGCFCADPKGCHRSVLRDIVAADSSGARRKSRKVYASPACSMPEIED